MGWFTLFVAAVCCVRIFVPVFFREKTEEYDRLEQESRTKMRNLEQEMLEKPVELCLYSLQSDELARLKRLQKDYLETLFCQKAKLETWQKKIFWAEWIRSACWCFWRHQQSQFLRVKWA